MGKQRLKILCISTKSQHRDYLQSALILNNFDFYSFATGTVALIAAKIVLPDIFIVDLDRPLSAGLGTVQQIRQYHTFAKTPIIAMTDDQQLYTHIAIEDKKYISVLRKPVNAEKLYLLLETYLNSRR